MTGVIPEFGDIAFDKAAYDKTREDILNGIETLTNQVFPRLGEVSRFFASLTIVPGWLIEAAVNAINGFVDFVNDVLQFVVDVCMGISAPIGFYMLANEYRGSIREQVNNAAGTMNGLVIGSGSDPVWQGAGADAYKGKIKPQVTATTKVADILDKVGAALSELAGAGLLLYLAVAALAIALSSTLSAVILEALSVIGLPAVPPTALTGGAVIAALLAGVKGGLDYVNTVSRKFGDIESAISDNSAFAGPPVGSWPVAVTAASAGVMDDGSVTDGDADWSVPAR